MKVFHTLSLLVVFLMGIVVPAFGAGQPGPAQTRPDAKAPKSLKGAKVLPGPFRVKQVTFNKVTLNGQTYLAAAVIFNRNVDAASVKPNLNIRMLRKNDQHFWVDASTQNNKVNVRPNFITWVSGAPLETGVYIMHLRGTIKSADGVYLDCNGDGKGEGGNLPAYESQMYQAVVKPLIPIDGDRLEQLRDSMNR